MGSYDGAETCEIVGLHILSQLQHLDINVGLYRDDGLAACNKTPQETEKIKQDIYQIFKDNKLKITIDANQKTVDFLDITMDLRTGEHKPYMKPNNTPLYVHRHSNHPPNIIKNIPENMNKRLSAISSNKAIFNKAAQPYQEALKKSGYNHKLEFNAPHENTNTHKANKKRNRKRQITWFNPPYSNNVTTRIGEKFLAIIDTCFPQTHRLHKLLNRNTIKLSYSCMPNMKQIIASHNKAILDQNNTPTTTTQKNCNCRKNKTCPLDGQCQTESIIYQATVTRHDNNKEETYVGLTENTFKTRYNGHTCSFRDKSKRYSTALSNYIWTLKNSNTDYTIRWKIVDRGRAYSPSTKICNLCLKEKYIIICKPQMASLNSRNELKTECRHRKKHLLYNL